MQLQSNRVRTSQLPRQHPRSRRQLHAVEREGEASPQSSIQECARFGASVKKTTMHQWRREAAALASTAPKQSPTRNPASMQPSVETATEEEAPAQAASDEEAAPAEEAAALRSKAASKRSSKEKPATMAASKVVPAAEAAVEEEPA